MLRACCALTLVAVATVVPPAAWEKLLMSFPSESWTLEDDVEDACIESLQSSAAMRLLLDFATDVCSARGLGTATS